jgi:hypothetical protein
MRVAAAAVWAQWLQYPHLIASAQYDREMARINLFSVADHDADYSEDLLDPSAAAALRACPGGMDAASFGALAGEDAQVELPTPRVHHLRPQICGLRRYPLQVRVLR